MTRIILRWHTTATTRWTMLKSPVSPHLVRAEKVSAFIPFTKDPEEKVKELAAGWRARREGAELFSFYFRHYLTDDDGTVFEERYVRVHPLR